jgi:hypothetical protein
MSITKGSKYPNDVPKMSDAPSSVISDSIVLATAAVSGTFSSSTTFIPGICLSAAAATA